MKKLIVCLRHPGGRRRMRLLTTSGTRSRLRSPRSRARRVTQGDIVEQVSATGSLEPLRRVDVGSQVSGVVKDIYVDFNYIVKKDQVLAQIDPTLLQIAGGHPEGQHRAADERHRESARRPRGPQGPARAHADDGRQRPAEPATARGVPALGQEPGSADRVGGKVAGLGPRQPVPGGTERPATRRSSRRSTASSSNGAWIAARRCRRA